MIRKLLSAISIIGRFGNGILTAIGVIFAILAYSISVSIGMFLEMAAIIAIISVVLGVACMIANWNREAPKEHSKNNNFQVVTVKRKHL